MKVDGLLYLWLVAYTKNGDQMVGQIAKRQAIVIPNNMLFSVQRFIGRKMSEVDEESKQVAYLVNRDDNGGSNRYRVSLGGLCRIGIPSESDPHCLRGDWLALSFRRNDGIDMLKEEQALQRSTFSGTSAKS